MSHPSEQELVMYRLGDSDDGPRIERHLQECEACRRSLATTDRLLAAADRIVVPEPDGGFESRIWERQRAALWAEGRLASDPEEPAPSRPASGRVLTSRFWSMRRLAFAGALAASLVLAFLAGLYTPPPGTAVVDADERGGDRLLLVAVGEHLQRSRMVLVELVNADATQPLDLRSQRAAANALLADSRLYRQTASLAGEAGVAELLGEVERVLLEVARGPEQLPAEDLAWLRRRIESQDLLFKVSVIEGTTRRATTPPRATGNI